MNGIYVNGSNSPYTIDLSGSNTGQLPLEEVRLFVDTTIDPITINLPQISKYPGLNVKIYITDYLGNAATNNITINAYSGDNIQGAASIAINSNRGALKFEISSFNEWVVSGAGGSSPATSGVQIPIQFQAKADQYNYTVADFSDLSRLLASSVVFLVTDEGQILTPPFGDEIGFFTYGAGFINFNTGLSIQEGDYICIQFFNP